jgi:2'-5' RNA ligase
MGPWRTESAYVDQVPRRMAYEAAHPHVTITYHRTYWQAVVREQGGETVVSRYELKALLDKLESLDPPESVKALTPPPALADEIRQAHSRVSRRPAGWRWPAADPEPVPESQP